jgi:hypothetical protein
MCLEEAHNGPTVRFLGLGEGFVLLAKTGAVAGRYDGLEGKKREQVFACSLIIGFLRL